jgi:two-component system CheB/CheR fusion protein
MQGWNNIFADGLVFISIEDENDTIIGFVKILRDITARKQEEDAIKKYAKELGTQYHKVYSFILSHDLRVHCEIIQGGPQYLEKNFEK